MTDATIQIKNLNKYAISDENGKFKIENLCTGKLIFEVAHLGCEPVIFEINFTEDMYKVINLEHHIEELDEINIKSKQRKLTKTAQETVIITKTIEKYSDRSLGDALKEVSGVSSINTGNNIVKPIINGLHSSRIIISTNNVRLQDQEWGIEHAPNIDINTAGQISVIKGTGTLAYSGDAIGGAVIIKPNRVIKKDTIYGKTIIGSQTNGLGHSIATNINKSYASGWFAQLQGSYKRNGDFKTPDYYLTNTGAESKGISARFGKKNFEYGFELYYSYLNNEIGILRAAHIGNVVDLANSINASVPNITEDSGYHINEPKQEIQHHLFKTSYYKRFKNFGKVAIQYDYQNNDRFEFDIRTGGRSGIPAIDLQLQTHSVSTNAKIDANLERKYNFGLLARYQNHFASPDTGFRRLIPDYDKYDFGVFATTEWILNDKLTADAGLRYDFNKIDALKFYRTSLWESQEYDEDFSDIVLGSVVNSEVVFGEINPNSAQFLTNPVFSFHNISAGIGVKYKLSKNNQISFGYNAASRPPNPSELFSDGIHHSAARYEIGDLRIKNERSNRISASYNHSSSKFDLQIETFYNKINDFIYLIPAANGIATTIRGPFPEWEYIQTDALLYGADFSANYHITSHWDINHKSAFIKGYDKLADLPLLDIPPFTTSNSITYNNSKWYNFSTSLQSEWAFEQNEFPTEYNYTISVANDDDIEVDLSPPAAYHLLHLQSEITLPVTKQSSLNISLNINNVLNTSYRSYLNRLRFFADELGRNVSLQIKFNY